MENIIKLDNGLILKKDFNIYEVFYKGYEIGYFICSRLKEAIETIESEGFYDGRNYTMRMKEIDDRVK